MAYVNLGQVMHPVGSIYQSSKNTSPANLFGGSWSALTDQKFWLPSNSYNSTGGEWNHTLTIGEMPSHTHSVKMGTVQQSAAQNRNIMTTNHTWSDADWPQVNYTGGGCTQQHATLSYLLLLDQNLLNLQEVM